MFVLFVFSILWLDRTQASTLTTACVGFVHWALSAVGVGCIVGMSYPILLDAYCTFLNPPAFITVFNFNPIIFKFNYSYFLIHPN